MTAPSTGQRAPRREPPSRRMPSSMAGLRQATKADIAGRHRVRAAVVESDGGMVALAAGYRSGHVSALFVHPDHQGRGSIRTLDAWSRHLPFPLMPSYSYIWQFQVAPDYVAEFERHYGPDGSWVKLFEQAAGYRDTVLLRNRADPLRYVTIDTWESFEAYQRFRSEFLVQYRELDALCADFTTSEVALGEFSGVAPDSGFGLERAIRRGHVLD